VAQTSVLIGVLSGEQRVPQIAPIVTHFNEQKEAPGMNKDQVTGQAKDIGGKIQEEVGKVVGSNKQQAEGLGNQAEGKVQEKVGDVKDVVKGSGNR
jgi:uncharacterized protein YjbJ (UPF0337 family)